MSIIIVQYDMITFSYQMYIYSLPPNRNGWFGRLGHPPKEEEVKERKTLDFLGQIVRRGDGDMIPGCIGILCVYVYIDIYMYT